MGMAADTMPRNGRRLLASSPSALRETEQ